MVGEATRAAKAQGWAELAARIPPVLQTFLGDNEWCVCMYVGGMLTC